jgi:hypothetical protein
VFPEGAFIPITQRSGSPGRSGRRCPYRLREKNNRNSFKAEEFRQEKFFSPLNEVRRIPGNTDWGIMK